MAQGMELLDNGTKVFTGPGAAFGTDALLLARFAMPRRKETALEKLERLKLLIGWTCAAGVES